MYMQMLSNMREAASILHKAYGKLPFSAAEFSALNMSEAGSYLARKFPGKVYQNGGGWRLMDQPYDFGMVFLPISESVELYIDVSKEEIRTSSLVANAWAAGMRFEGFVDYSDEQARKVLGRDSIEYMFSGNAVNGRFFVVSTKVWGSESQHIAIEVPTWDGARTFARALLSLCERVDVVEALRTFEAFGAVTGDIDPNRPDPRLFTRGPLDNWRSLRELEMDEKTPVGEPTWRNLFIS
jgi:hypothetical protein